MVAVHHVSYLIPNGAIRKAKDFMHPTRSAL